MAEFPGLGRHCSHPECHLLDFLPIRCDACQKDFCVGHFSYEAHHCESSYKKDSQVPVCPLCLTPIPVERGVLPDIRVGEHIDRDCKADPRDRSKKIYTNRCAQNGCRRRELVPIQCPVCSKNFCLKHRHPSDHDCRPVPAPRNGSLSNSALAAISRLSKSFTPKSSYKQANYNNAGSVEMSEDEALARAIDESLNGTRNLHQGRAKVDESAARNPSGVDLGRSMRSQRVPGVSPGDRCMLS